jgi:hypothetical protein
MIKYVVFQPNEDGSKSPVAEFDNLSEAFTFAEQRFESEFSLEKHYDLGAEILFPPCVVE